MDNSVTHLFPKQIYPMCISVCVLRTSKTELFSSSSVLKSNLPLCCSSLNKTNGQVTYTHKYKFNNDGQ